MCKFVEPRKPPAQPEISVRVGKDRCVRVIVPTYGEGEQSRVIGMKLGAKHVEVVTQEAELTVVFHPDPRPCDELWIDGEGKGKE